MKLEVGMYVRTKNGMIAKIISKEDVSGSLHREEIVFILDNGNRLALHSKKVIKASHNIKKLIEEGDVITTNIEIGGGTGWTVELYMWDSSEGMNILAPSIVFGEL